MPFDGRVVWNVLDFNQNYLFSLTLSPCLLFSGQGCSVRPSFSSVMSTDSVTLMTTFIRKKRAGAALASLGLFFCVMWEILWEMMNLLICSFTKPSNRCKPCKPQFHINGNSEELHDSNSTFCVPLICM